MAVAEPPMAAMMPMAALITAAVAASVAAIAARIAAAIAAVIAARDLLHDAAANHPAAGVGLAVRDAAGHGPASLVGHQLAAHHAGSALLLAGNALVAANL